VRSAATKGWFAGWGVVVRQMISALARAVVKTRFVRLIDVFLLVRWMRWRVVRVMSSGAATLANFVILMSALRGMDPVLLTGTVRRVSTVSLQRWFACRGLKEKPVSTVRK